MAGVRLDQLLVARGLYASRERARAAILAGDVRVGGTTARKAGESVPPDASIDVVAPPRFVSRGGDKLESALEQFGIDPCGMRVIDIGASTGGFTDCVLQHRATSVVALDVGYGQLAWSLRTDERVTVIERTNVRSIVPAEVGAPFDLLVCDVSFIPLGVVMPHLAELIGENGQLLALVKPQFEAGKGRVGKKGVVREAAIHEEVLEAAAQAARAQGLIVTGLGYSPIKGPEGNIEFWLWAAREGEATPVTAHDVVVQAHERLGAPA